MDCPQGESRPATLRQIQRETLNHVDHLLSNSIMEMIGLVKTLRVCDKPFTIVPYAADLGTLLDPNPAPFVDKYGLGDFVLQVGRIEEPKNQLLQAYSLRQLGIQLVLMGGNQQRYYLEWSCQFGPPDLKIIPIYQPGS